MRKSSTKKTATAKRKKGPSKASLREIPPLREDDVIEFGRGPKALERALAWARSKRGRPKKGERAVGTETRSVRLSKAAWKALEETAEKEGTTVHALIREAIAARVRRAA
jgi:hypothetical protein